MCFCAFSKTQLYFYIQHTNPTIEPYRKKPKHLYNGRCGRRCSTPPRAEPQRHEGTPNGRTGRTHHAAEHVTNAACTSQREAHGRCKNVCHERAFVLRQCDRYTMGRKNEFMGQFRHAT